MNIATRIFLSQILLVLLGTGYIAYQVLDELSPRYRESLEEPLVDSARVLAAIVAVPLSRGGSDPLADFRTAFSAAQREAFSAKVYDLTKTSMDLRVYITDRQGIVLYHSVDGNQVGADYSKWNDVYRTLKGEYGARTSRDSETDPSSTVLYVSAPIMQQGAIIGVVSVGKPTRNTNIFIAEARRRIHFTLYGTLAALLLFGFLTSKWIGVPVRKLTEYARAVSEGKTATLPSLGSSEMAQLGDAFSEMRKSLEGKSYIEDYVQTLTHELKSPLAAIRGAAEILQEDPPAEQRARFTKSILDEGQRIQTLVDRLLELSSVESRRGLSSVERIAIPELIDDLRRSVAPQAERKHLTIECKGTDEGELFGERFLMRQAIANLLQNAIEFSPQGETVELTFSRGRDGGEVSVGDRGPGIPDFAKERIFERFYSLERPDTGRKSSGLGLSFVREVVELHGGEVSIEGREGGGTVARAFFPDQHPLGR